MTAHRQTPEESHQQALVEIARLRGEIEALKQSPSWRITRPLRALKRVTKRTTDKAS